MRRMNDINTNGLFEIMKKDHEYAMSEYLKKPNLELDSNINRLSDEEKFVLMWMIIESLKEGDKNDL